MREMFKLLIGIVLLAHGIGHSLGLLQMFKVATVNPEWHGDSWLLSGPIGVTGTQIVGGVLWLGAIVGFVGVAAVVVGWLPASWFVPLAISSSAASLAGIVLFPVAFPPLSTVGAVVVDLAVLAAIWMRWLPSELPG
jgi:hypothetical protein